MQIRRQDWWPTPIWNFDIPVDEVDNSKIELECYKRREIDTGKQASNYRGWQSNNIYSHHENMPNINRLIESINKHSKIIFDNYGVKEKYIANIEGIWLNINTPGSSNGTHIHTDSILSGIYYVRVPEDSGDLVFQNNLTQAYINGTFLKEDTDITKPSAHYKPVEGAVIIFPSWIPHYVLANNSDKDRISIAFNFKLV
jgi:uncharacterized protein (TIGR02466 family)